MKVMRKNILTYNVGDRVKFRTREISFYVSRIEGTATSIYLHDYPEEETTGTIRDVDKLGDKPDMLLSLNAGYYVVWSGLSE